MDFCLSPKTLNLLDEDEFDWTSPESKNMPTFHIFTPFTKTSKILRILKFHELRMTKVLMFFQDFLYSDVLGIMGLKFTWGPFWKFRIRINTYKYAIIQNLYSIDCLSILKTRNYSSTRISTYKYFLCKAYQSSQICGTWKWARRFIARKSALKWHNYRMFWSPIIVLSKQIIRDQNIR